MTRGSEDPGETEKKKTRQEGLVQSPTLGCMLWFTDLEHLHPETPQEGSSLRDARSRGR